MTWTSGPVPPDPKTADPKSSGTRPSDPPPSDTAELPIADLSRSESVPPAGHRPALFSERFAARLPAWLGSIRVRLALLYSVILFVLGSFVVIGIYVAVSHKLDDRHLSAEAAF